jgi:GntR family transcriptional regulator
MELEKDAVAVLPPPARKVLRSDLMAEGPLYKQIKREIAASLNRGEWKAGEILPSEPQLAKRYSVGISTIRAAVGELVASRILTRKQGKGTFVSMHDEQRSIYQFFHVVRDDGVVEMPVSELISFSEGRADDRTADLLRLPRSAKSAKVYKLRTIMRVGNVPIIVSDIVLPAVVFKGMTEKILRAEGVGPFTVYQRHFDITIIRTESELKAIAADPVASRTFGVPKLSPMLQVSRVAFTFGDLPVEYRLSRLDTRNYHFRFNEGERA